MGDVRMGLHFVCTHMDYNLSSNTKDPLTHTMLAHTFLHCMCCPCPWLHLHVDRDFIYSNLKPIRTWPNVVVMKIWTHSFAYFSIPLCFTSACHGSPLMQITTIVEAPFCLYFVFVMFWNTLLNELDTVVDNNPEREATFKTTCRQSWKRVFRLRWRDPSKSLLASMHKLF